MLFAKYDVQRAIPSLVDGFKPSQRKVLYGVLKRKLAQARGAGVQDEPFRLSDSLAIRNSDFYCRFSADVRPNLAPKPLENDGARPAVPVAPKTSPADQF